jgi:hypothetical protein
MFGNADGVVLELLSVSREAEGGQKRLATPQCHRLTSLRGVSRGNLGDPSSRSKKRGQPQQPLGGAREGLGALAAATQDTRAPTAIAMTQVAMILHITAVCTHTSIS